MSYDFYGLIDTGGPEPQYLEPRFDDVHPAFADVGIAGNVVLQNRGYSRCGNYTSNVSPIWARCLTGAALPDEEVALADLSGRRCGDIVSLLSRAVEWGIENLPELRELDPPNGWGNVEGAITYLWDIQRFCEANPKCELYISR